MREPKKDNPKLTLLITVFHLVNKKGNDGKFYQRGKEMNEPRKTTRFGTISANDDAINPVWRYHFGSCLSE